MKWLAILALIPVGAWVLRRLTEGYHERQYTLSPETMKHLRLMPNAGPPEPTGVRAVKAEPRCVGGSSYTREV